MNDVRDITIARNGVAALVSYENKVCRQTSRIVRNVDIEGLGSTSTLAGGDGQRWR